jgi:hypothetical protein
LGSGQAEKNGKTRKQELEKDWSKGKNAGRLDEQNDRQTITDKL